MIAFAVGFAVSVAQYLPTIFAGSGRFVTLTTEAVTLAASSNRRVIGVYTALQSILPLSVFAVALSFSGVSIRRYRVIKYLFPV